MHGVVGRERELTSIATFLDEVASGPSALIIEGEPGIGKTTVWRAGAQLAEERGFRVLSCRPAEPEAKLSFSALADLVEPIAGGLRRLPAPQRRALEVALLRVAPGDAPPDARAVAAAFRSLLSLGEQPVLLAVDDAQWLDSASATAIEFAFRRLRGPVGLLATRRPGTALDGVLGGAPPLRLPPLSLAAIHHIVREQLGTTASRPMLTRVHETAGGNPFYALQIARVALAADVQAGAPLPLPGDLSELLRRRVESLAPETREVLLTVAASAAPSRLLLDELHDNVARALEEAEDAGLIDAGDREVRFAHPLYRAAVYASVGHEHRRRVHARLATAVVEVEEQARHLALAATPPDEETAKRVHAAARQVAARGAPAAAAELLEQAIRLGDEESDDAVARLVDLGHSLHTSGNSLRAAEVLQQVKAWSEQPVETQIKGIWTLNEALYWTAGTAGPVVPVRVLESLLPTLHEPEVRAAVHAKISASMEYDMSGALEHADAALRLLEPLGDKADPQALALALGMRARNRLALGFGLDRDAVERAISLDGSGEIAHSYGHWLKYVDDFDAARRWLERSLKVYEEMGDYVSLPNVLQQLAMTECWAGNLDLAADHASRATTSALDVEIVPVGPKRVHAIVEAHRGDDAKVRVLAEDLCREGWAPGLLQHLEIALGLIEFSLGRLDVADRHLRRALEIAEEMHQLEPGVHRVHGDAAEVALALGDKERAREIAELLEEHGRRTEHKWSAAVGARTRALLHADDGDLDASLEAIEEALGIQESLPMPYELGRTLLARGQIERRAKHRREARASLQRAQEIFTEIGANLWAVRAADELKRIPIRRGAKDELTDGEQRVAELVASGLTNKEVAKALFISPKTVEASLSRVYGKLGIRSRAELGARMAERAKT